MKTYPDRAGACTAILLAILVLATAAGASGQSFKVFEGDGVCGAGYRLATYAEASGQRQAACAVLGEWYIARLAGGGSMDGPGYQCKTREKDDRKLGHSLCVQGVASGPDTGYYYRLTTQFRGDGMCLDVFNGGPMNNMTHLVQCANYSGQFWRFTGPDANGSYRLSTEFRGPGMCLDIFNGGQYNNQPNLAACANLSGQLWNLRAEGDWYRLTTQFRGPDMCLDIFNGGPQNNQPVLAKCANYSGQLWKLTRTDKKVN